MYNIDFSLTYRKNMNENEFEQQNNEASENEEVITESLSEEIASTDGSDKEQEQVLEKNVQQKPQKQYVISYFKAVALVLLTAILVFQATYLGVSQKYQRQLKQLVNVGFSEAKIQEISRIYKDNYIYDYSEDDILNGLIYGFIAGTGDRHGRYYTAEEFKSFTASLNDRAVGIGVIVGHNTVENSIEIYKVYKDSPADKSGIKAGDHILAVEGKYLTEVGYDKASDLILGQIGTDVLLTVKNESGTSQIKVTRNEYTTTSVDYSLIDGNIGYIKIENFYASTPNELKDAVSQLKQQKANSVVFDLRGNTGGSLSSIKGTLEYMLPEGDMFKIINKAKNEEVFTSKGPGFDMPAVVLVNGSTASAAELFTSALMDYDIAVSVGTKTYGKGSVSEPFRLSDGSYIYLSSGLYYPPKSDNFDKIGITPDHVVDLSKEASKISLYKLAYEDDDQLKYAVGLLKNK